MQETFKMFLQEVHVHVAASADCLLTIFFLAQECCHSCNGTFKMVIHVLALYAYLCAQLFSNNIDVYTSQ